MGANGSYDKNLGGVPKDKRTHTETGYTVLGFKVLLQTGKEKQTSNILNSNSKDATYLIAKLNEDDTLSILHINVNKGHQLDTEINLVFDTHGNLAPYNGKRQVLIHISGLNILTETWEENLSQTVGTHICLFQLNIRLSQMQ